MVVEEEAQVDEEVVSAVAALVVVLEVQFALGPKDKLRRPFLEDHDLFD